MTDEHRRILDIVNGRENAKITDRGRARRLALEFQMAAVCESFGVVEEEIASASMERDSPKRDRVLAVLRRDPMMATIEVVRRCGVSDSYARGIRREWLAATDFTTANEYEYAGQN